VAASGAGRRDRRRPAHGYIYVIRFSTGAVKAGQTGNPAARLRQYSHGAAQYDVHIVEAWLSRPHTNHLANEAAVLAEGRRSGQPLGSESFLCDYGDLVTFAEGLPFENEPVIGGDPKPAAVRALARQVKARRLRAEGKSIRQIAREMGVSLGTAHADVRE
jgi:hypothetical protein